MDKTIAVLATGSNGSSIGADFTKAGYDVTLIDQWPAHVETMKAHGLHITMPGEELQIKVKAIHLCELANLKPQFDIVFLTSKANDSRWLAQLIEPYLKSDGVLVSMQNSMCDEWIAPIVGAERGMGCVVELSSEMFEPGLVQRDTDHNTTRFILGELDGKMTPRVKEIAQIMSVVGRIETSTNIWGAKWAKLVYNTMGSTLQAITGVGSSKMIKNPKYVELAIKLGRETAQVGMALGHTLELFGLTSEDFISSTDETVKRLLLKITSDVGKKARSSTLQDLLKGRLTEVSDYINGLVVKKGREVNVPTPFNELAASLVRQIEQGKLEQNVSNLDLLD